MPFGGRLSEKDFEMMAKERRRPRVMSPEVEATITKQHADSMARMRQEMDAARPQYEKDFKKALEDQAREIMKSYPRGK